MSEQWIRMSQNEQLAVMVAVVLLTVIVLGSLTPTGGKAYWLGFAVGVAFVVWKTWPAYYPAFVGPYPANLANSKMLIVDVGAGQLLFAGGIAGLAARLGYGLKNRRPKE
jgi:hypothetical protein